MAVTKGEFSELVIDLLSGGDSSTENKYHPEIVWKAAEFIYASIVAQSFFKDADGNAYDINGDFITAFKNVDVKLDSDRDEKYSDLPTGIISVKDNRGLRQVSSMKDQKTVFTLIPNGALATHFGLESSALNPYTEMYVEGGKIFYVNINKLADKVLIKMIGSISGLGIDNEIPIPANLEKALLDGTLEFLREPKATNQDKINDSNPNG